MMKYFVILLLLAGCASVEETQAEALSQAGASENVETSEVAKRKLQFDLVVRQGDKVVSQPKIQGLEGHSMSLSFNVNLQETHTDMIWTVEEDIVEMTVSVVGPDGSQENHQLSFALGTATQFEIEHLSYLIDVTATEI